MSAVRVNKYKRKPDKLTHISCGGNIVKHPNGKNFICEKCRYFVPEDSIKYAYKQIGEKYQEPEAKEFTPKKRRRTRRKK